MVGGWQTGQPNRIHWIHYHTYGSVRPNGLSGEGGVGKEDVWQQQKGGGGLGFLNPCGLRRAARVRRCPAVGALSWASPGTEGTGTETHLRVGLVNGHELEHGRLEQRQVGGPESPEREGAHLAQQAA